MKKIICPICDRGMDAQGPAEWPAWPFCSDRCRLIDLGRWLGGNYAVPATPSDDPEEDEEPPAL